MDNDWGNAGFVPFLMALDGGMEVLALVSGETERVIRLFFYLTSNQILPIPGSRKQLCTRYPV